MAFTKYAALESTQILDLKGSKNRSKTASLSKIAEFEDYRTDDGYLYARIRAISSRVNKNHDGWPAVELAGGPDIFDRHTAGEGFTVEADSNADYGYSTFLGKPIFVDHHNSNPERARGVIVDAKLHVEDHKTASLDPYYSSDEVDGEHLPGTWVELLLEVDAKSFPRLAKAIIQGSKDANKGIDGFSMGCDVERSVCNICKNAATSPDEYCNHIKMKGAHFDYINPKTGKKESRKSYENCYGIKFFEISAVFDPADETALIKEVRTSAAAPDPRPPYSTFSPELTPTEEVVAPGHQRPVECPDCMGMGGTCPTCHGKGYEQANFAHDGIETPERIYPEETTHMPMDTRGMTPMYGKIAKKKECDCWDGYCRVPGTEPCAPGSCEKCDKGRESAVRTSENELPQADMIKAPEEVDTLREEVICPVCGSTMDNEECDVCGYMRPPEGLDNPDLTKALNREKEDSSEEAFEDSDPPTNNAQTFAHVKNDMAWTTSIPSRIAAEETEVIPNSPPATEEPYEEILDDQDKPVTSSVRTAEDFIAAAGATRRINMDHTADAASGAPAIATPDRNVDVDGVGGVYDASNEEASHADTVQTTVEGVGGVEGVGEGDVSSDTVSTGDEHSKNIEAIPTQTYPDGSSAVEKQADPVSGEPFPASEDGVKSSAWTVEANDDSPYPSDDGGLGGGVAVQGVSPADPMGNPDERVNVLDHVTSPANNSGPTDTWSGTEGNGVLQQQPPVTNESLEGEDGVKSSSHIFMAFKLADLEVDLGLLESDRKYERVAELENQSAQVVEASLRYAQRVKTAGLRKSQRVANRLPALGRSASVTQQESEPKSEDTPEEFLFGA